MANDVFSLSVYVSGDDTMLSRRDFLAQVRDRISADIDAMQSNENRRIYLYRRGDGNYPRALIELKPADSPYAALRALVANDYMPGRRARRHIVRNIETDGEPEFGINATVYTGPDGEEAFGAAWLTAELQPLTPGCKLARTTLARICGRYTLR